VRVGRTRDRLLAVAAKHAGIDIEVVDVSDPYCVSWLAARVATRLQTLATVIKTAAIQTQCVSAGAVAPDPAWRGLAIGVRSNVRIFVANAFVPLSKQQPKTQLIHVGFGIGYEPLVAVRVPSKTRQD
jgi:uncharacterized oxidoreductase